MKFGTGALNSFYFMRVFDPGPLSVQNIAFLGGRVGRA